MAKSMTEDAVRDLAREALGLVDSEIARAGVGQLTTFNQLGFPGVADKPDGWYLPNNKNEVAVVLETKATRITLGQAQVDEVLKNVRIMQTQYKKVVGILYNGEDIRVFKGEEEVKTPTKLQSVSYYLSLYTVDSIDKERIYELTAKINNGLHFEFGIKNLYHRMIFTACALVAERYGAGLRRLKNMGYATFHTAIHSTLSKSLEDSRKQNAKIDILLEEYSDIKMNTTDNQQAINDFIDWIVEISECVNSNEWRGEDVMGIFFNEFNRYKKKSEAGQVFTPEHITDFMYKILDVNKDDYILDATCGSGGFLVKAMANMIREAGGMQADAAAEIKSNHLYGIEFDREIYALACANMLIHKDGKTNLEQMDARTDPACKWMKSKPITKVLMNPPYENKYGCMKIVENVLDNVPAHTQCAFILPDKKLEKASKAQMKRILKNHRLRKVIKLPEDLFFGVGITTSIFVFEAGVGQDGKEFFACYIHPTKAYKKINIELFEEDGANPVIVNTGFNNGVGGYANLECTEKAGTITFTDTAAKSTDSFFYQERDFIGYPHVQGMYAKTHEWTRNEGMFLNSVIKSILRGRYDFIRKMTRAEMLKLKVKLPAVIQADGTYIPDWAYMGTYMSEVMQNAETYFKILRKADGDRHEVDTANWREFRVGDLFQNIVKPVVLHTRQVVESPEGIPYVVRTKFNNGIKCRVQPVTGVTPSPAGVISWGAENATFFYQPEPFLSGRDIYYIDTREFNPLVCMFLASCLQTVVHKYPYNFGLFPDLLKEEKIKLPVIADGTPDWIYMGEYMRMRMESAKTDLVNMQSAL